MNDIIKPTKFDLTKNLHGHVRVETRSRWTGKVIDSQEKDNLITDAVQKMLMTTAWCTYGMGYAMTPIWAKALGGIMLFNNTLTEQASNIYFPASAKLVGYAGQDSDATNPMAGSYNGNESVAVSNGFTTVWDFLTSQANGTIASLARTSFGISTGAAYANLSAFDLRLGGIGTTNSLVYYLGYDETNKYVYLAFAGTTTYDGVSYDNKTIYRAKCDLYKVNMTGNVLPVPREWEAIKTLTSSDGSQYARHFTYDKWANNFAWSYNSTTVHLVAMDGTHSTVTTAGASGTSGFAVSEHYYWKLSTTNLYRTEKTNLANTKSYTIAASQIFTDENDICYAVVGDDVHIIYPDDTIIIKPLSGSVARARQLGSFYALGQLAETSTSTQSVYLHPRANYLGTIANLDSPVTKTSSQTMKITYTLTEA